MNIPAIVVTIFFIMVVVKFFGKNILNKISYLFGSSFFSMGLNRVSFVLGNIDNIILVVLFFTVGIVYVILYDIEIKNQKTDKVIEKHSLQIIGERVKEGFSTDTTPLPDNLMNDDGSIIMTDTFKKAFKNVLDVDLERQFNLPEYNDICRNKEPSQVRKTCELLNDKNTCDSASCCMWCNVKNTCVGGKNGLPLYDIDNDCVKAKQNNDSEMLQMAKETLKEIKQGKINKLEKDFEYKQIETMTYEDHKIILQLVYHFIKQKKHRDELTKRFNKIPKLSSTTSRLEYKKRYHTVFNKFVEYYVKINPNSTFKLYKNQGESVITHFSLNNGEKYIELNGNADVKELLSNCMSVVEQDINFSNAINGIQQDNLDNDININPSKNNMNVINNISEPRSQMQIMQSQV